MTHASLFTGIGGFDLAAQWMGWQNVFQVEKDEWCQKLLKQKFQNAERFKDIKEFHGGFYAGTIDVLSGGFPCQPYSTAGLRKGKEDDRHLWPEMLRVIREVSPRWVVGENVRGLTNWNGGLVFDEVQADLESAGYEVLPFLLPACAVNAPHRRDRIWFVAYSNGDRQLGDKTTKERQQPLDGWPSFSRIEGPVLCRATTITDSIPNFSRFPTESPLFRGNDGVSHVLDRIKGLGNAVVPKLVYQLYKAIEEFERGMSEGH